MPMDSKQAANMASTGSLNHDYTLCECDLEPLRQLVVALESTNAIEVRKEPSVCLTKLPAECEVAVNGQPGYGLCLGEEPVRAYCIAVVDALLHNELQTPHTVTDFLAEQGTLVARRDQDEFDLILQTQVDFKLMEQA
jgi:alpha-D-ribose 1-methylphosphonate 5-triphosphate synthase subunit PhnG